MRHAWIVAAWIALLPDLARSQDAPEACTLSFGANHAATFPRTITGEDTIKVDLSKLPAGVEIYRAVLRPGRMEGDATRTRPMRIQVTLAGREDPLRLLGPRFVSFDVTEELKAALKSGARSISFSFAEFPGYQPVENRLDVTCSGKAKREIPRVGELATRHRGGQTLLTWKETQLTGLMQPMTIQDYVHLRDSLVTNSRQYRFRIYRSAEPISAATIGRAEFVDEIAPLSGWNGDYHGIYPKPTQIVPRYVVGDNRQPVPAGTAVYAHNPRAPGSAYYAVSLALDGEEDLSRFDVSNATPLPIAEEVGPGVPVLQRVERPEEFNYVKGPMLHYYVRWESPPTANLPSRPIDYLVAVPPKPVEPAPVGLHLHCWGANLDGGYGWWYDAAQGALLISTNQVPYDWWTGYHENLGTWKSWRDGVVRDYTQTRLMSFLDWATTQWKIDTTRVFTAGSSMGGSGAPSVALRRADRIAWCVSWVGVHRPADSPQFTSSYERVYGEASWKLLFQDRKTTAFDHFDDAAFVRRDPARETPLIVFSNGKNDRDIGWAQAREFWNALQETRRPHVFRWGQDGHGQRAQLPGPEPSERELGVDVRLDRTLPAFTKCSLDDDPGDGDPATGARQGQSNLYLTWDASQTSVVDEVGRWSMLFKLNSKSPKDECTVDVTPRRCFQFRAPAGTKLAWKNLGPDGEKVQSGEIASDRWGLVTVPGVKVTRAGNRLFLEEIK